MSEVTKDALGHYSERVDPVVGELKVKILNNTVQFGATQVTEDDVSQTAKAQPAAGSTVDATAIQEAEKRIRELEAQLAEAERKANGDLAFDNEQPERDDPEAGDTANSDTAKNDTSLKPKVEETAHKADKKATPKNPLA